MLGLCASLIGALDQLNQKKYGRSSRYDEFHRADEIPMHQWITRKITPAKMISIGLQDTLPIDVLAAWIESPTTLTLEQWARKKRK